MNFHLEILEEHFKKYYIASADGGKCNDMPNKNQSVTLKWQVARRRQYDLSNWLPIKVAYMLLKLAGDGADLDNAGSSRYCKMPAKNDDWLFICLKFMVYKKCYIYIVTKFR